MAEKYPTDDFNGLNSAKNSRTYYCRDRRSSSSSFGGSPNYSQPKESSRADYGNWRSGSRDDSSSRGFGDGSPSYSKPKRSSRADCEDWRSSEHQGSYAPEPSYNSSTRVAVDQSVQTASSKPIHCDVDGARTKPIYASGQTGSTHPSTSISTKQYSRETSGGYTKQPNSDSGATSRRRSGSFPKQINYSNPQKIEAEGEKRPESTLTSNRESSTSNSLPEASSLPEVMDALSQPDNKLKALDCLVQDLESKKLEYIERSRQEVSQLKASLKKKVTLSNPSPQDLDKALSQRERAPEVIQSSITESEKCVEVFLQYYREALEKLSIKNLSLEAINSVYRSFKREIKRCNKRLPIYAYRLDIMKMIEDNQVSIVIGETGSGKSTQLVQYLYEAGYSSNGLIVCTQPRKLAAISLAKHVSGEVNEWLGETYGYIGAKSRQSESTRVVYMTDHILLNECIADPSLSKYSCLVIDEAHERSIHTDIVIAFIKRCLPNRPDLKVIITSATINPTLFSSYFGGKEQCPILTVPGCVYPVQVEWREPQAGIQDYIAEAVRKVHEIHVGKRNESGDILVFLTCPAEIERACKLAQQTLKNAAVVLPLHGKLQPEDQQKIFDTTLGKRKVVFSTNVAETSITIPGIVHVIDTGLSKEMRYDPQKNVNSLEIRPICKSSADQRKGRAGRTCPGQCYRLYSERDYARMSADSTPEILKITLAFAVIKLYEFGIKEVHSFEFVESPDPKALDDAIENLKFLGAIKNDNLTELGLKMALLPLEPNLSKVLLDGVSKGIGIEAAAAVSISTLAGRVFFRPVTAESQEESDKRRLAFCQQTGDQMTYLHTYFQWSLENRRDQSKWCEENFVNSKSMWIVQHMVDELRTILQKCRIFVRERIMSLIKADVLLPKIFFDAFLRNICVHLGHNAVGYWSERLPDEQLVIHPASALQYLSSVPQCVVYEKTQKTSQHFLLQALPVREEWIQEAITSGKLDSHPAKNSLFQLYQVRPLLFISLGPRLMLKLDQKYPRDRRKIVSEFSDFNVQPVVEYLYDRGALKVFAQERNHQAITQSITKSIEACKTELKNESYTCGLTSYTDDVMITIGLGGSIQRVLMPGDFCTILVRGLCFKDDVSKAERELCNYGECTYKISQSQKCYLLYARFQNPADAERALKHQFISFPDTNVRIQFNREQSKNHFCLKVEWWRRQRCFAYIDYCEEDFEKFFSNSQSIFDYESTLSFYFHKKHHLVQVTGLERYTTEEEIKKRLWEFFPSCKNIDIEVFFRYTDAFEETDEDFSRQRDHLIADLSECAPQSEYLLEFFRPPRDKSVLYRARIYFSDTALCLRMFKHLSGKSLESEDEEVSDDEITDESSDEDVYEMTDESIDEDLYAYFNCDSDSDVESELKYHVEMTLSSSTRYTKKVFAAIKPSVVEISHALASSSVAIECNKQDNWGNTFVNVTATDSISAFTDAKKELTEAVQPDTIVLDDSKQCQYASTANFKMTIEDIQSRTLTYIKISCSSLSTSSIAIYGTKDNREIARKEVELHLESVLQGGVDCFEIDLKRYSPGLMKHLVDNVTELTSPTTGIAATLLYPRKQTLTIFANEAGHEYVLSLLASFKPGDITQQVQLQPNTDTTTECCVCFESHDSKQKKTFYYRLDCCGHVYCRECIEQQLEPLSIVFPVNCAASNCKEQLVWRDFENLFRDEVKKFRDITSASLNSYVAMNSKTIRNCITPNCEMVFVVSEEGKRFVCGHCGENICTRCCTTWHEGFDSCASFRTQGVGDAELEEWMREDPANRKKCPNCSRPIEKNDGCIHVACKCRSHICWVCMKYFKSDGECYAHMEKKLHF